jgi:hypothetical protein
MRVLAFPLLCVLAGPALAQSVTIDALSLQLGARARILGPTAHSKYTMITVASTSRDTLRYSLVGSPDTTSVSWQQIKKIDVSVGAHRHFGRGLGIGLLVGLVGGAILGAAIEPGITTRGADAVFGAGFFGFYGAIGGAVVGLAWRTENWLPVTIPRGAVATNRGSVEDP